MPVTRISSPKRDPVVHDAIVDRIIAFGALLSAEQNLGLISENTGINAEHSIMRASPIIFQLAVRYNDRNPDEGKSAFMDFWNGPKNRLPGFVERFCFDLVNGTLQKRPTKRDIEMTIVQFSLWTWLKELNKYVR